MKVKGLHNKKKCAIFDENGDNFNTRHSIKLKARVKESKTSLKWKRILSKCAKNTWELETELVFRVSAGVLFDYLSTYCAAPRQTMLKYFVLLFLTVHIHGLFSSI